MRLVTILSNWLLDSRSAEEDVLQVEQFIDNVIEELMEFLDIHVISHVVGTIGLKRGVSDAAQAAQIG